MKGIHILKAFSFHPNQLPEILKQFAMGHELNLVVLVLYHTLQARLSTLKQAIEPGRLTETQSAVQNKRVIKLK